MTREPTPRSIPLFIIITILGIGMPNASYAYSFVPSELEWVAWPMYCKARYLTTDIGERQEWNGSLSRSEIEVQRNLIGSPTFIHIHHYCAGLAWMMRARVEGQPSRQKLLWSYADREVTYTFERIPESSPIFATIAGNLAQVRKSLGKPHEAIGYGKKAVEASPSDYQGYIALALVYRDQKKLEEARDTLLSGDAATGGKSRELHYHLGLIYLELKQPDKAMEFAKLAYDNGYPLPGLKQKLQAGGNWHD